MNASLDSIRAGLKPIAKVHASDRTLYFIFGCGQWRRQIGEGHSPAERARRAASRKLRIERNINRSEA